MKKKRLSINDIAKELNISKTCVSLILNGKAQQNRISSALEEKVLKYASDNAFSFNAIAQSLATGKTKVIALLVERISDYFFSKIAYYLENIAQEKGYKIIYCSTENNCKKTIDFIDFYRSRQVDGFIIVPPVGFEKEIESLINDNYPMVLLQNHYGAIPSSYVILDDYNAVREATGFFIDKLSKAIAYVDIDSNQSHILNRRKGYLESIERSGLRPFIKSIPVDNDSSSIIKEICAFLKINPTVETILFANNNIAVSGMKAISLCGRKISTDIDVTVFDGHEIFDSLGLDISVIVQPVEEMAKQLFNLLYQQINPCGEKQILQIQISAKLLLKDSLYGGRLDLQ